MMRAGQKTLSVLALIAVVLGVTSSKAYATLMWSGSVGAVNVCATDQNIVLCVFGTQLPDSNPAVGILQIGVGPVIIDGLTVATSVQTAVLGPPANILNSSSLSITNNTTAPVTATFAVGATGFTPPAGIISTAGSGTWVTAIGSTALLSWYNDPTNAQGAETPTDTPGVQVDTFSDTATASVDAFGHAGGPFAVSNTNPFSMTMTYQLTIAPGGSLISRGQSMIAQPAAPVPEPSTLLLIGSGLGLLVRAGRRQLERDRPIASSGL